VTTPTVAAERDGFIAKWRTRWPEWQIAEAFLPVATRAAWLAWFALRQELVDAAWAGADPRPGEAKLAWWAEELQGWTHGRRRHPLGAGLQSLPAPWARLATALPTLVDVRERAGLVEAHAAIAPFADVVAAVDAVFANDTDLPGTATIASALLGQRALAGDDAAALAWREDLLRQWPSSQGARAERIHAALVRGRLQLGPLSRWRTLVVAWRAARPRRSVP
jgi:hypothetical protein